MNRRILLFLALATLSPVLCRAEDDPRNESPDSSANAVVDLAQLKSPPRKITPLNDAENASSTDIKQSTGIFKSAFKTVCSLLVVLVLIFSGAWMLKRNKLALGRSNASEVLEVLGRRTIAQRQSIYLVRLGTRILVLGSGTDGLTSLSEITDPVEVDYLAGLCKSSSQSTDTPFSFLSMFRKETRRNNPAVDSALVSSVEIRHASDEAEDDFEEPPSTHYEEEVSHA